MEEQKQMGDEIAEARLYAIRVEYGQAFERTSLEQVKKDGAELIRLGQSILDNANKGLQDKFEKTFKENQNEKS